MKEKDFDRKELERRALVLMHRGDPHTNEPLSYEDAWEMAWQEMSNGLGKQATV